MFQSYDPSAVEQLERIAKWLERRVAEAEANDPKLAQLKQAERDAAAKVGSSSTETEHAALMQAHDSAVQALVQYVLSR